MAQEVERLTVNPDEAAKLLGISRNATYDGIARGEIPAVRIGRRLVVPLSRLRLLLDGKLAT